MSKPSGKNPAFQFYPKDWTADTGKLCPASRGIWIDLICNMWAQEQKGVTSGTEDELACACRCKIDEIQHAISQFERLNTCDVSRDSHGVVTLSCRRMIRDEKQRRIDSDRQKKHRRHGFVTSLSQESHATSPTPTPTPCTTYIPPLPPQTDRERVEIDLQIPPNADPQKTALLWRLWNTGKFARGQLRYETLAAESRGQDDAILEHADDVVRYVSDSAGMVANASGFLRKAISMAVDAGRKKTAAVSRPSPAFEDADESYRRALAALPGPNFQAELAECGK